MTQLVDDWWLIETAPDEFLRPSELANKDSEWLPACVPGTVAQSLAIAGTWSINDRFDFDSQDYWYRSKFSVIDVKELKSLVLHFDGLATLCEVWLNDRSVLKSDNMFLSHQVDISNIAQEENTLHLCFRSLTKALSQRRPRPRWKTRLVDKQQLRWFRTTLLGRIPGWTPPVAPVGPWKTISLSKNLTPFNVELLPSLAEGVGTVVFSCELNNVDEADVIVVLTVGDVEIVLNLDKQDCVNRASGVLYIDDIERWMPHTHGTPKLYSVALRVKADGNEQLYPLGSIGFKEISVDQAGGGFSLFVNGKAAFCRGACWTINDIVSLSGDSHELEQTLTLMRDAGVNMIRIGGTMVYEQDGFYQLCDKLGIMVWQDFMFANMDYPVDDEGFNSSIKKEVSQLITRLRKHVCVSIYCGNSEIAQQAAMLSMPQEAWANDFFKSQLPRLCHDHHPTIPYVPSSPVGGNLPFYTDTGISHYYGVGAYQRPVSELRTHNVKFTSECLGFSNIPVAQTRNKIIDKQIPVIHHPKWKERVPRDTGTGWDFEDIRDHYLEEIFSVNPVKLRSYDNEKYLALSEVVSGEVMSQVYAEWRSEHSNCSGGLVWFLKDLWPGAGWGIIDSNGMPKAVYYYLKRCWQSVNVCITNESLNGLHIHIINEKEKVFSGGLEVTLLNEFSVAIACTKTEINIDSESADIMEVDSLLEGFFDATYTYRFGSAKHSVVSVRLVDQLGCEVSTAYYFPNSELPRIEEKVNLKSLIRESNEHAYILELSSDKFLYAVNIDIPGYFPDDNFFHMMPGVPKLIEIKKGEGTNAAKGYISAVNMNEDVRIKGFSS